MLPARGCIKKTAGTLGLLFVVVAEVLRVVVLSKGGGYQTGQKQAVVLATGSVSEVDVLDVSLSVQRLET